MTEPRDLTDLVPADLQVEVAAAVAALELHGPSPDRRIQHPADRDKFDDRAAWGVQFAPNADEQGISSR